MIDSSWYYFHRFARFRSWSSLLSCKLWLVVQFANVVAFQGRSFWRTWLTVTHGDYGRMEIGDWWKISKSIVKWRMLRMKDWSKLNWTLNGLLNSCRYLCASVTIDTSKWQRSDRCTKWQKLLLLRWACFFYGNRGQKRHVSSKNLQLSTLISLKRFTALFHSY